jgi:hypothetical protein
MTKKMETIKESIKLFAKRNTKIIQDRPQMWEWFNKEKEKPSEEDVFSSVLSFWEERKIMYLQKNENTSVHAGGYVEIEIVNPGGLNNTLVFFKLITGKVSIVFDGDKENFNYNTITAFGL